MIVGESIEDYHAREDVSSSKLRTLLTQGPLAYREMYIDRSFVPKRTAAMKKGNDFEDAVCGRIEVAVVPEGMKLSTKAGIAFKKENEGKLVVGAADAGLFTKGVGNVRRKMEEYGFLTDVVEQPTFRAEYAGLPGIQARPDWWTPGLNCAPDLKTTDRLDRFHYSVEDFMYHVQCAFVRQASGIENTRHAFVVVEKKYPFPCRVVWLHEDYVRDGMELMKRGLDKLASHYQNDTWPLIEQDSITLFPPERTRQHLHLGRGNEDDLSRSSFADI